MFTVMDHPLTSGELKVCASSFSQTWKLSHAEENGLQLGQAYCSDLPHMLSQNRARVLGFSWLRRCLNQRWMVRTSQSSCLDRPSNLFSSGCWQDKTNTLRVRWLSSWHKCHERTRNIKNDKENTGATLVIAVKTFSRMALGCAFCGPLAWIFRPMAHGLAINLQLKYHDTLQDQHRQYL